MNHRRIALALAAALSLSLLSACGGSAPKETETVPPTATVEPTQAPETQLPETQAPETQAPETEAPVETKEPALEVPVLTLSHSDVTLKSAGASFFLRAKAEDGSEIVYTSGDETVATVEENGKVTAVAPGTVTVTVTAGDLTAECIVRCHWEETPVITPAPTTPPVETEKPAETVPPTSNVDLAAFAEDILGTYTFGFLSLADAEMVDGYYPGLGAISTEQSLAYVCMMSMNNGEFVLVQVKDSADVASVKQIMQTRIDGMINGGAWYPEPTEQWTNNSRVVSNGSYVMMVVHENADDIVAAFNDYTK